MQKSHKLAVLDVLMSDVIGDYDVPDNVEEWQWVESIASYSHVQNGSDGIWEFLINLALVELAIEQSETNTIPVRLRPLIEEAKAEGYSYILFNQGT
jgi:hypothetical protein